MKFFICRNTRSSEDTKAKIVDTSSNLKKVIKRKLVFKYFDYDSSKTVNLRKEFDTRFRNQINWLEKFKDVLTVQEKIHHQYDWDRFAATLGILEEFVGNKSIDVLELGFPATSTKIFGAYFTNWRIKNFYEDLRMPSWNWETESADLVLSTEVIEHLSDIPGGLNETFLYTGAKNLIEESSRVLRKSGTLFVTVPNINWNYNIFSSMKCEIPLAWWGHIREYTKRELEAIIQETNLIIDYYENLEMQCVGWDWSYLEGVYNLLDVPLVGKNSHHVLFCKKR